MTGMAVPLSVQVGISIVVTILTVMLHEVAHGLAALWLGDDTARRLGRLSLNPLRHIDPLGTVLLPGVLAAVQWLLFHQIAMLFGWARPVPVAAHRFPSPRRAMALVAAAGPLANFILAWLAALASHALDWLPADQTSLPAYVLLAFMEVNLVLGLFNLLPIPPLDGGRMLVGILPARLAAPWARLERAGIAIVLLLVVGLPYLLAPLGFHFDPADLMLDDVLPRAFDLVCRLAFVHV